MVAPAFRGNYEPAPLVTGSRLTMTGSGDLEAVLTEAAGAESPAAMAILRRDPDPSQLLRRLSKSANVDVRGWVVTAAQEVLGIEGTALLTSMLDDPDADIRVMAMSSLEQIDSTSIPRLAGRLRRRLRSSNPYEALATSWALARLGDRDAMPLLEDYRDGFEDWQWQHKAAEVVLLYMTEPDEIVRRIRTHDYDRMLWLVHAATLIGTPAAIAALQECAVSAPDSECRGKCSYSLEHD